MRVRVSGGFMQHVLMETIANKDLYITMVALTRIYLAVHVHSRARACCRIITQGLLSLVNLSPMVLPKKYPRRVRKAMVPNRSLRPRR